MLYITLHVALFSTTGIIKSTATHTYTVDRIPHQLKVEQTITYKECDARPLVNLDSAQLAVSRIFVIYNDKEQLLRYATANKISDGSGKSIINV